jgi:hypothetical protein
MDASETAHSFLRQKRISLETPHGVEHQTGIYARLRAVTEPGNERGEWRKRIGGDAQKNIRAVCGDAREETETAVQYRDTDLLVPEKWQYRDTISTHDSCLPGETASIRASTSDKAAPADPDLGIAKGGRSSAKAAPFLKVAAKQCKNSVSSESAE